MFENVKTILNLKDDSFDEMIRLYLSKVEAIVIEYCNVEELNEALRSFVEDKVVSIMKSKVSEGTQNTGEIKSVSRGDTRIEYNVGDAITDASTGANLTSNEMTFLNKFRRVRCF